MLFSRVSSLFLLLIMAIGPALAQNASPQSPAEQKRARYLELQQAIRRDFAQKQYDEAEKKCLELIELAPKDPGGQYNLACAQVRQGRRIKRWRPWRRP